MPRRGLLYKLHYSHFTPKVLLCAQWHQNQMLGIWETANISPKLTKKRLFIIFICCFDFPKNVHILRFERMFSHSFYSKSESYVCSDIKIVWRIWGTANISPKMSKNGHFWLVLSIFTLAISKCYGNVRIFFPGDNSLISDRKSHNSDFFGLVVRCLLFNPEAPGSNPCVCANFFQPRGSVFEPLRMRYFFKK